MTRRSGPPPTLTQDQIRRVVAWQAKRQAFRKRYGTVSMLAARLQVPQRALYAYIQAYERNGPSPGDCEGFKRRPLSSTAAFQVARWVDRGRQFAKTSGSVAKLAREFGVSPQVIYHCIRKRGLYSQLPCDAWSPAPSTLEKWQQTLGIQASNDWRSDLLRRWQRVLP